MDKVALRQFGIGALLKLGLFANLGIWALLGTVFGVLALFGFNTVR